MHMDSICYETRMRQIAQWIRYHMIINAAGGTGLDGCLRGWEGDDALWVATHSMRIADEILCCDPPI